MTARGTRAVLLAAAGAAAVLVAAAQPAARVLVVGAPGDVAPSVLARALITFAPGLLGYGLLAFLTRAHYARGDARTAALAAAVGWVTVVALDVVLVVTLPRTWTVAALGVGTTVGMTIAGCWLAVTLHRSVGERVLEGTRRSLGAGLLAAAVAAAVGTGIAAALPRAGVVGSLLVTMLVCVVTVAGFLAVASALDRPTVRLVLRRRMSDG